jgi:hypothetical protein
MKRDVGDLGWWFDKSALTPQATAEPVRESAVRAAPLRGGCDTRVDQAHDALVPRPTTIALIDRPR